MWFSSFRQTRTCLQKASAHCDFESTDGHIPLDDGGQWLRHYPTDKAAKIVLYCRSGKRSTVAALKLVAAGYTNVWHLDGGMVA